MTGSFDDWQKNTPLLTKNEQEGRFEAEILVDLEKLPEVYQEENDNGISGVAAPAVENDAAGGELPPGAKLKRKLIYKFVLDGEQWVTDAGQSLERDYEGNLNNIRFLENVIGSEKQTKQTKYEVALESVEDIMRALEVKEILLLLLVSQW